MFMAMVATLMVCVTILRFASDKIIGRRLYKALMAWLIFFFLGEFTYFAGILKTVLMAPPTAVIWKAHYYLEKGWLQVNIASTMGRFIYGFSMAIVLGIPMGLLFGLYDRLYQWVAPTLNFIRMIPPPAILPFAVLMFGIGETPGIFVITLGCFFPIMIATAGSVRDVESLHKEVVLTMGGTGWDVLWHAIIPSSIPAIITGVRIGFGIGWLVLVSSEIVAADSGLGFMIQGGRIRLDTPMVFLGMATICVLGLSMDFFLKRAEKFFTIRRKGGADYVYY